MEKKMKVAVSLTLDYDLIDKISYLAKKECRNRSDMVNYILHQYFQAHTPELLEEAILNEVTYREEYDYEDAKEIVLELIRNNRQEGNFSIVCNELAKYQKLNAKELILKLMNEGEIRCVKQYKWLLINDELNKQRTLNKLELKGGFKDTDLPPI